MSDTEHQDIKLSWLNRHIGMSGPQAFPYLVIIILLISGGVLVKFTLGDWGKPFDIKHSLERHDVDLTNHADRQADQHANIVNSLINLTYVSWLCSPLNTNKDAMRKCSELDLMRPQSLDSMRAYR